jgi:microcystin-dependent protein
MSRANYINTISLPLGIGGSLIPLVGIAAIPFIVNPDGTDGAQAIAYTTRSGATEETDFLTDDNGTINYWLETGNDYDIQISDPRTPPRLASYEMGFSAAEPSSEQLLSTGDTKFSFQTGDHGLNTDGTYQWLLVTSDSDGTGRSIPQAIYTALWDELGQPAIDGSGNFKLPNISGRQLVAAGAASGLTARTLAEIYGNEEAAIGAENLPPHQHGVSGTISGTTSDSATGVAVESLLYLISSNVIFVSANPNLYANIKSGGVSADPTSGDGQSIVPIDAGKTNTFGANFGGHGHNITDPHHNHTFSEEFSVTSDDGPGASTAFSTLDPSFGMNLFVKT